MHDRIRDRFYGIGRNWPQISKRIKTLNMAALQIGGGLALYHSDVSRGTSAVIQQSGILSIDTFALVMFAFGVITLLMGLRFLYRVNALVLMFLTTPFILFMIAALLGINSGLTTIQGVYFFALLYIGAMVDMLGVD